MTRMVVPGTVPNANVTAMASDVSDVSDEAFNIASGRSTSVRDLVATVTACAGSPDATIRHTERTGMGGQTAKELRVVMDKAGS